MGIDFLLARSQRIATLVFSARASLVPLAVAWDKNLLEFNGFWD